MALTVQASGTQSATVTTEHTLVSANTTAGVWVLVVDTTNMVGGTTPDILELRIKTFAKSGGSAIQEILASFQGVQGSPIKKSIPVESPYSITMTLKQTQGTSRNFDWYAATY